MELTLLRDFFVPNDFFSKAIGISRGSIRTTDEQVFVKKETVYFSVPFV